MSTQSVEPEPKVCFRLEPFTSLGADPEDSPPYSLVRADGLFKVQVLEDFEPHRPLVNGWQPGSFNTALLVDDGDWNPIIAPLPDGSGRWGVIGGSHFLESVIERMELGPFPPRHPNWRIWTFSHQPVPELCELMRVYFNRRRLQQAKFRAMGLSDYQSDRLANLSSEGFLEAAVSYHQAVYDCWRPFTGQ